MNRFTTKCADRLGGALSGFDHLVFRGTLRRLAFVKGVWSYLSARSFHAVELHVAVSVGHVHAAEWRLGARGRIDQAADQLLGMSDACCAIRW